jgi:DNA-binding CsgD family transcriptional regulator
LDAEKQGLLYKLYGERQHTIKEICDILDISRSTLYTYLHRQKETKGQVKQAEQPL